MDNKIENAVAVRTAIFTLIRKIAERNGSVEYYPLQEFEDGGKRWLTCEGHFKD